MKKDKDTKKIDNRIHELESKIHELTTGWQRTQADFDNFRKRSEEQKKNLIQFATVDLIQDILPVLDNFQRSNQHMPEELKNDSWARGMQFVEKQLEDILTSHGLMQMEIKVGDKFDPAKHEAIICDKCQGFKPDQITEVVENGYLLNSKVLRPAKVKVAK